MSGFRWTLGPVTPDGEPWPRGEGKVKVEPLASRSRAAQQGDLPLPWQRGRLAVNRAQGRGRACSYLSSNDRPTMLRPEPSYHITQSHCRRQKGDGPATSKSQPRKGVDSPLRISVLLGCWSAVNRASQAQRGRTKISCKNRHAQSRILTFQGAMFAKGRSRKVGTTVR